MNPQEMHLQRVMQVMPPIPHDGPPIPVPSHPFSSELRRRSNKGLGFDLMLVTTYRETYAVPLRAPQICKVSHKNLVFSLPKQLLPMTKLPTFLE